MPRINMVGMPPFGRLTVSEYAETRHTPLGKPVVMWWCDCTCGNRCKIAGSQLRRGRTNSCGCLKKEMGVYTIIHNDYGSSEYKIWRGLIDRCHNKNSRDYKNWGERGIIVCDRWRYSFTNFLIDMGRRPSSKHSIDRFPDNDGPYTQNNCRWATTQEQARNRRTNHNITFDGITKTLTEWAHDLGISSTGLNYRLKHFDLTTAMQSGKITRRA